MAWFGKGEPETATVAGKDFACQVCGNHLFRQQDAVLHGALASFMNLEWASPRATLLICSACGYVHWFLGEPT
jgi:predicted nucleic-acid-binding Zn-ribbon protein